jgi:hypothetical protein
MGKWGTCLIITGNGTICTMSRTAIPFHISIGPCTSGATYPVRATFGRAEILTELQLPEHVLDAAASLLEPGGSAQLGDAALFGRSLGRALLTPPLRDLLLKSGKVAAQSLSSAQAKSGAEYAVTVPPSRWIRR